MSLPPVVRVSGVRMGLDRPDHPYARNGLLWVSVEWRGGLVEAHVLGCGRTWLTSGEKIEAERALDERDRRLEKGDVTL